MRGISYQLSQNERAEVDYGQRAGRGRGLVGLVTCVVAADCAQACAVEAAEAWPDLFIPIDRLLISLCPACSANRFVAGATASDA